MSAERRAHAPIAAPLARLEVPLTEPEVERLWRGAGARRDQRRARRKIAMASAATLAVVALALVVRSSWASPEALRLADGRAATAVVGPSDGAPIRFVDGSVVTPSAGTDLSVSASVPAAIELLQRDGRAHYDVVPGGGRRWSIRCGSATVEVLGTAFVLEREEATLHVRVERGRVRVVGLAVPEGARELGAGEALSVEAYPRPPAIELAPHATEAPAPTTATTTAPISGPPSSGPPSSGPRGRERPSRVSPPSWRSLAEAGEWDAAYDSLGESGVAALGGEASVEELLLLSDVCRRSRHPREAAVLLSRIVEEHPSDPNAALAAFSLGRIELERLHRPDRAVRALERALALGLPSGLVADAEARLRDARAASSE